MTPSREPPSSTNVDKNSHGESLKLQITPLPRPVFANSGNEEVLTSTRSSSQNSLREVSKLHNGSLFQPEFARLETANEVVNSPPFTLHPELTSRMNKPVFGLSPTLHELMEETHKEAEKIKADMAVAKSASGTANDRAEKGAAQSQSGWTAKGLCGFPPPRFTFGHAQSTNIFDPLQRNTIVASDVDMKGQKKRQSSSIFRKSSATSPKYATPGTGSIEEQHKPKIAHIDATASTATPPEEAQRSIVPELHTLSHSYRATGNRIRILEAKERGHLMQIQALGEIKRLHVETIESQFATIAAQFRTIDLLREELKGAQDQIRVEVTAEFEKKNLEQCDTEVSTLKSKIGILEVEKKDLCELLISTKQDTDMGKALKECEERLNDVKKALDRSTIYA